MHFFTYDLSRLIASETVHVEYVVGLYRVRLGLITFQKCWLSLNDNQHFYISERSLTDYSSNE